jgi:hypothetical protein
MLWCELVDQLEYEFVCCAIMYFGLWCAGVSQQTMIDSECDGPGGSSRWTWSSKGQAQSLDRGIGEAR